MYELLRRNIDRKIMLTAEEWNSIIEKLEFVKLKKNQFLQVQDATSKYEAFVLKGSFKFYILKENGTESVLYFAFEDDWMCDIESFYYQKPTKFNIKALEDSEIVVISKTNKIKLFKEVPNLFQFHTLMVERANAVIQERLMDVLNKTTKEMYLEFVKKYPNQVHKINNKNLSSYLGVSQEFLSKIKKRI